MPAQLAANDLSVAGVSLDKCLVQDLPILGRLTQVLEIKSEQRHRKQIH